MRKHHQQPLNRKNKNQEDFNIEPDASYSIFKNIGRGIGSEQQLHLITENWKTYIDMCC